MLLWFVILYLMVSVGIGLFAVSEGSHQGHSQQATLFLQVHGVLQKNVLELIVC